MAMLVRGILAKVALLNAKSAVSASGRIDRQSLEVFGVSSRASHEVFDESNGESIW